MLAAALALLAGACGGTTTPTPPPVTEDPPTITCPAPQTIQLTAGEDGVDGGPDSSARASTRSSRPVSTMSS